MPQLMLPYFYLNNKTNSYSLSGAGNATAIYTSESVLTLCYRLQHRITDDAAIHLFMFFSLIQAKC